MRIDRDDPLSHHKQFQELTRRYWRALCDADTSIQLGRFFLAGDSFSEIADHRLFVRIELAVYHEFQCLLSVIPSRVRYCRQLL